MENQPNQIYLRIFDKKIRYVHSENLLGRGLMESLVSEASFKVFPYMEAYLIYLWLLWAVLLFWPLSFIDLNCDLSNLVYALFLMAAGLILILAAPQRYTKIQDFPIHLIYCSVWLILSIGRWWLVKKKRSAIKIRKFNEAKT